jgi:hypothetical protein
MKFKFITGLLTLQLAAAVTAPAQTYTFTVGNPETNVQIADHIGGEDFDNFGDEQTLESYNLRHDGKNLLGLLRFSGPTGSLIYSRHHGLPEGSDYLQALKGYDIPDKGAYVVAERVASDGSIKSAVLIHYDQDNGSIVSAIELAALPAGYSFIRIFDVMENFATPKPKRILCTVSSEGIPVIAELLLNDATNQYTFREYRVKTPPKSYRSVHYVRAYHYGSVSIGAPAFYGLADEGAHYNAFCYYEDLNTGAQIYDHYMFHSISGIKGVTGVQMNGNYGPNGFDHRIEMAFTDADGGICIQQKDELTTLNWQRYYQFPDKEKFILGYGRDGHGTKSGSDSEDGMGYFIGAWLRGTKPADSRVTALHFNGANGNLGKARIYDISGQGIFKGGSFPSTTYDKGYFAGTFHNNYTFLADGFPKRNTFRFGTGNTFADVNDKFFCSDPYEVPKVEEKRLNTVTEVPKVTKLDEFMASEVVLEEYNIGVEVVMNCPPEKGSLGKESGSQLTEESKVSMDARHIRIAAPGRTINALRVLSIDGRTMTDVQGFNTSSYEHRFNTPLAPGIYIVHIVYNDHTVEARKVSVR